MGSNLATKESFVSRSDVAVNNESLIQITESVAVKKSELQRIKVDIYRNIQGKKATGELLRDIIKLEDVSVPRREGK